MVVRGLGSNPGKNTTFSFLSQVKVTTFSDNIDGWKKFWRGSMMVATTLSLLPSMIGEHAMLPLMAQFGLYHNLSPSF